MKHTVVHVSDSDGYGGAEQVILQLLEGLDDRWNPVLVHPPLRGPTTLIDGADALGVARHEAEFRSGGRVARVARLVRLFRELRPSVVHVHLTTPFACRFVLIAAALARVPAVVATVHLFNYRPQAGISLRHRVSTAGVGRYIAVSKAIDSKLRHLLSVPARKIRLVRNAVRLDQFGIPPSTHLRHELMDGPHTRIVLVVARLARHKGHRYLLEAAAEIPGAVFVLAGDGPEREALRRQMVELGIADRVRLLGYRADVPELLASADVFVLPSLNEGLPLAILEAMAAGKPVVATTIGGTDEAVVPGETGLLVPPADPAALAAAIRTLLEDDRLARRLGESGRTRVGAEFPVEHMVRNVVRVYDELLV